MILLPMLYLPPLSYMALLNKCGNVKIEVHENYIKSSYRNRCEIMGSHGSIDLSIPLAGGRDHHRLYNQSLISYDSNWQHRHRMSIVSCYGSTPFFEHYMPYLEVFYERAFTHLFEYNRELLLCLIQLMKLNITLTYTDAYEKDTGITDLRNCFKPGKIPGDLTVNGCRLHIVDVNYMRVFEGERSPGLSCLDLLFNEGPRSKSILEQMVLSA